MLSKSGAHLGCLREDLLNLRPEPLDTLKARSLDFHSDRSFDSGERHVEPVLDRHYPGIRQSGELEFFVHFADQLLVRHTRRPLYEKLIREMDEKLQFPGLTNTWTMPVENRLDMALTGIKTPVGMKIQGPNLEGIQQLGAQIQRVLSQISQVRSAFAEHVSQGFYVNVDTNRLEAAKYGLTIADVQQPVASGIGGMNIWEKIESRERHPIN